MRKKFIVAASFVFAVAGLVGLVNTTDASAKWYHNDDKKVTICHRTNSVNNPYVSISVSENAVDGINGNNFGADHYGEHQGPVASSAAIAQALKDDKEKWGDIIPPLDGVHQGLNWTAAGQAVYLNHCNYVTAVTAVVTFVAPTCDVLGSYTIPTTEGVVYSIGGNTVAAGEYDVQNGETVTVVATAEKGYYIEGNTEWSYTFTAPTNCDDDGDVLGTSTPTVLPTTSGNVALPVVAALSAMTLVTGLISLAVRSLLTRQ